LLQYFPERSLVLTHGEQDVESQCGVGEAREPCKRSSRSCVSTTSRQLPWSPSRSWCLASPHRPTCWTLAATLDPGECHTQRYLKNFWDRPHTHPVGVHPRNCNRLPGRDASASQVEQRYLCP